MNNLFFLLILNEPRLQLIDGEIEFFLFMPVSCTCLHLQTNPRRYEDDIPQETKMRRLRELISTFRERAQVC